MVSIYATALKRLLDTGMPPNTAVERLVAYLTHHARTRDIAPALKGARALVLKDAIQNSVLVTEATANRMSDTAIRKAINAPTSTPIIRTVDTTLSHGWIIQYQGTRIDASAKHQLRTWYQVAQTNL